MSTQVQLMTADELLALPRGEFRYELVKGELIKMSPAGHDHGRIIMRLAAPMAMHVKQHGLGEVYAAETGFILELEPDTVRAPDIAFIVRQRVEAVGRTRGYWHGAPDLAVEVLSPDDRVSEVEQKVAEWLAGGAKQVWVVSPRLKTITVYSSLTNICTLTENNTLGGGDLIPGFEIAISEIFVE